MKQLPLRLFRVGCLSGAQLSLRSSVSKGGRQLSLELLDWGPTSDSVVSGKKGGGAVREKEEVRIPALSYGAR